MHHEGALRASLQAEYGLRLLPYAGGRTEPHRDPFELGDYVEHLPPGCALMRAFGGEAAWSVEAMLIRENEYTQRVIAAGEKASKQQRIPLPESAAEARAATARLDARERAFRAIEARNMNR